MKNLSKLRLLNLVFLCELRRVISGVKYRAEIDITDNCNLRCRHCYHFGGKDFFQRRELPVTIWRERLLELKRQGIKHLLLGGGEPALRPDILFLADKLFPFVYTITNGTIRIPPEFNRILFVSLDGLAETNDYLRGEGVFNKVLDNYSGDGRVIINMTLMEKNYRQLEGVVKIAEQHKLRGVVCNVYTSHSPKDDSLFVTPRTRAQIINELKRVKKVYPRLFFMTEAMIGWYRDCDHRTFCYWGDQALHYDVSWQKRRCFGIKSGCSNCGCFAGTQDPLTIFSSRKEFIDRLRLACKL